MGLKSSTGRLINYSIQLGLSKLSFFSHVLHVLIIVFLCFFEKKQQTRYPIQCRCWCNGRIFCRDHGNTNIPYIWTQFFCAVLLWQTTPLQTTWSAVDHSPEDSAFDEAAINKAIQESKKEHEVKRQDQEAKRPSTAASKRRERASHKSTTSNSLLVVERKVSCQECGAAYHHGVMENGFCKNCNYKYGPFQSKLRCTTPVKKFFKECFLSVCFCIWLFSEILRISGGFL